MFDSFVAVLRDIRLVISDAFFKRERPFLENSVSVNLPKSEVWQMLWSADEDHGNALSGYKIEKMPDQDGLYKVTWRPNSVYPVSYLNVIEWLPGEAFVAEKFFEEDEDPEFRQLVAFTLTESEDGKQTTINHYDLTKELTSTDKLLASFETRWMLQMFKEHCELKATGAKQVQLEIEEGEAFWAVLSSAIAFFGCWFFYDLSWAVLILMALVFHEFGHVIALNFLGINPPGAFLLPFVGKAAMSKFPFRNELEHAFCALMGPAISLLPSSIFFALYLWQGYAFLGAAAAIFAFINLLSFLPVYPFGSERVVNNLISSIRPEDILAAIATLFIVAIMGSLYASYYIVALVLSLTFLLLFEPLYEMMLEGNDEPEVQQQNGAGASGVALSSSGALVVLTGLTTCMLAHGAILYSALSDNGVSALLGH